MYNSMWLRLNILCSTHTLDSLLLERERERKRILTTGNCVPKTGICVNWVCIRACFRAKWFLPLISNWSFRCWGGWKYLQGGFSRLQRPCCLNIRYHYYGKNIRRWGRRWQCQRQEKHLEWHLLSFCHSAKDCIAYKTQLVSWQQENEYIPWLNHSRQQLVHFELRQSEEDERIYTRNQVWSTCSSGTHDRLPTATNGSLWRGSWRWTSWRRRRRRRKKRHWNRNKWLTWVTRLHPVSFFFFLLLSQQQQQQESGLDYQRMSLSSEYINDIFLTVKSVKGVKSRPRVPSLDTLLWVLARLKQSYSQGRRSPTKRERERERKKQTAIAYDVLFTNTSLSKTSLLLFSRQSFFRFRKRETWGWEAGFFFLTTSLLCLSMKRRERETRPLTLSVQS